MKKDSRRKTGQRYKTTVTLDGELLRAVRRRFPGAPKSRAIEAAVKLGMERAELGDRMRTLEMICRATILMLSEYMAGGDPAEAARLRNRFAQRALDLGRKLEARQTSAGEPKNGLTGGPDPGMEREGDS